MLERALVSRAQEAQVVIEAWRQENNAELTDSAIEEMTPTGFIQHYHDRSQAAQESISLALL